MVVQTYNPNVRKWKQEDQEGAQAHPSNSWFKTSLGHMKPNLNEKQSKELNPTTYMSL